MQRSGPRGRLEMTLRRYFTRTKLYRPLRYNPTIRSSVRPRRSRDASFSTSVHSKAPSDFSSIIDDLKSRPPHLIHDNLTPNNSHLLNVTLSGYLPKSCFPQGFSPSSLTLPDTRSSTPVPLPQGHHLVYFPTQVPTDQLLPDGTDTLQYPGDPFTRRLWAGGSLLFKNSTRDRLKTDNRRYTCVESVRDVVVRGVQGEEKMFVDTERRYGQFARELNDPSCITDGYTAELTDTEGGRLLGEIGRPNFGDSSIIEHRNLVFIRGKKEEKDAFEPVDAPDVFLTKHILWIKKEPDFMLEIMPSPALLFRFSALTFNAHLIHLDPGYAREEEGLPNCLVHGPLSLVLVISVLHSRLRHGEMIRSVYYKNHTPLLVNEVLQICVKQGKAGPHSQDFWLQTKNGRLAVKGTALLQPWRENEDDEAVPYDENAVTLIDG